MARPSEKLAESLAVLKALQDKGVIAFRANHHLNRTHRERLLKNGFIQEVMKGWYTPTRPDERPGETTGWYASYWSFCADYLNERFGKAWCLGPEHSIALHIGNWTVPRQLLVRTPKGGNKPIGLMHGTSLIDLRLDLPPAADLEVKEGLRLMKLPAALIHVSPGQFVAHPQDLRAALAMITEPSDILRRLLDGGHNFVAGRLAGAFRNIACAQIADEILAAMKSAGYSVHEADPFEDKAAINFAKHETSPHVNRLRLTWESMREDVLKNFPEAPGLPKDADTYLRRVEGLYVNDAYNSLSIEGYRVNEDLIERVRGGGWDPHNIEGDRAHRDALAARGYWQAFQVVEQSIRKVLRGEGAGLAAENDHGPWYRELFAPSVVAGLIKPGDLAGYRNGPVYIRRSMHVPPRSGAVRDLMPAFFELLKQEKEAPVRVVLGHFLFVYIHPYTDGNGRIGRFLMNVMMASGGYPWTVVPLDQRDEYMAALESASVNQDIVPFTRILADLVGKKG